MKRCPRHGAAWTLSGGIFDLQRLEREIASLEEAAAQPDFWDDPQAAQKQLQKTSRMKGTVSVHNELDRRLANILDIYQMLKDEDIPELEKEADDSALTLLTDLGQYELTTLLSGEHDAANALVEFSAGAGGSEACDWASMLFRMYSRWAERKGMKAEIVSETPGDVTGIRNAVLEISGPNAFGYLKAENGVHRLVRISPFDANSRRHTSFVKLEILPEVEDTEFQLNMDEIKEETLRSSGAGGQHVNKTESAVRLTHLPTGITVLCQNERSQHKNRASAYKVMSARLAEITRAQDKAKIDSLKGDTGPAEWGRQIRSYVMQPYTMVKDHRTGYETGNVTGVLDGDIDGFIEAFLRMPPDADTFIE